MIEFSFFGESHGKQYGGTIRNLPKGFTFDINQINAQLALRKGGYGRSERQQFCDIADFGTTDDTYTVCGDVNFTIANAQHAKPQPITALRSGHADLVGSVRYGKAVRDVAEIASARSSVCYVVLGAICRQLIQKAGISLYSYTQNIAGIQSNQPFVLGKTDKQPHFSLLNCPDSEATVKMSKAIDLAKKNGDSLGGIVVVGATGVTIGIGEIAPYTNRLDAKIAGYMMGIPSVKGIEFGIGANYAQLSGTQAQDSMTVQNGKICYSSNNCGGIVGGITTGKDISFQLTVKPVPTVKGVNTIDVNTLQTVPQHYERSDTCVVPNVGIIAQNILAFILADQMLDQNKI